MDGLLTTLARAGFMVPMLVMTGVALAGDVPGLSWST